MSKEIVGGGVKKVLYTLNTVRRMGTMKAAKALSSNNACKACALGMGGQMGGMTNELGEFPSVCNKSVQAQSSDTQPGIPHEIFDHTLADLQELDGRELEHLGRLDVPVFKGKGDNKYRSVTWDEAIDIAVSRLQGTEPDRSFFYSSGRSSNEAGFLFQLVARLYGTNNVTNCSYYCHQATSVALSETIGTGTSTIELEDLTGCDLIFVIGANPSSNHPRFIHKLAACRARGGHVIMINPAREPGLVKFAIPKSPKSMVRGGSDIASLFVQPTIGGDIAFFKGVAKALLERSAEAKGFIAEYTSGYEEFKRDVLEISWEEIAARSGVNRAEIEKVADLYASSKATVFAWGMGMTHHLHGVENIEYISNLALLRGMVGRPFAGLLPLRGHSNVQGIGTIGVKPVLPEDVIACMENKFGVSFPEKPGMDTMASMQAAADGNIDAAVIMGGNLFAANPNAEWAAAALDQIGFKLFLTTTLNRGHITGVESSESLILPVTARDEEWEPTSQESMFNFVRLSDGGITRLETIRPESVVLSDIAARLLPNCPIDFGEFAKHRELRKAIAEIIPGMQDLADIDVARREFHIQNRLMHTPTFRTDTGRANFRTHPIPQERTLDGTAAPFILTTVRSEGQFNSIIYEDRDSYRGTETRWSILMNKDDMQASGLKEGDKANVTSEHGEMRDVTVHTFSLPRGSIMAYYPEANVLTGTLVDPRSKTPSFKSTPVKLCRHDDA